jgi:predicted DNA-binding transcriptional regulator YafY
MTFFPEAAPSIDPECWEASFKALQLGHTLEMEYQIPGKPAPYRNKVDPYHVVGHKGEWYIVGKCHYKGAIRMFGISRIKKAHVTTEAFQIPADFQFETMWKDHFGVMTSEHEYQVRIRFRRDQAPYVVERDWHPEQCFEQCGNGDVLMSFPTRHLFEVTRWVLGWGSAATVLQPPELQAAVKKQLSEAMENY